MDPNRPREYQGSNVVQDGQRLYHRACAPSGAAIRDITDYDDTFPCDNCGKGLGEDPGQGVDPDRADTVKTTEEPLPEDLEDADRDRRRG